VPAAADGVCCLATPVTRRVVRLRPDVTSTLPLDELLSTSKDALATEWPVNGQQLVDVVCTAVTSDVTAEQSCGTASRGRAQAGISVNDDNITPAAAAAAAAEAAGCVGTTLLM